eukprot:COSAG03_NODE_6259_length_1088_cov_965.773509_1_plen_55_part_10
MLQQSSYRCRIDWWCSTRVPAGQEQTTPCSCSGERQTETPRGREAERETERQRDR